jgi:23S rRNA (adenine1618-N6)-methyltransferase
MFKRNKMTQKKSREKTKLHKRNKNRVNYDFEALKKAMPELLNHIKPNKFGEDSIDFSDAASVKLLNRALLKFYYGVANWDFPSHNLCPPIPGRADYIHYMADLLSESNFGKIPTGEQIKCIDIGVGASCIYPILGVVEYGWSFIGSDIDDRSIASAQKIVDANEQLAGKIELVLQTSPPRVFRHVIKEGAQVDVVICNPPFHATIEEAHKGTKRKVQNLTGKKWDGETKNFSGEKNELVVEGGEINFIRNMIKESKRYASQVHWFSSLVSKKSKMRGVYAELNAVGVQKIKTITTGTGNKSSQIVAWTFKKPATKPKENKTEEK